MRNDLGNVFKSTGQVAQAKVEYERALELDPTLAAAWNNLACIEIDQSNTTQALSHLSKAILCDPNLECAYENMVRLQ